MFIYAGIDEAGYGPLFGPLVISRCVFEVPELDPSGPLPPLWRLLKSGVCRKPLDIRGRIAVNDSKALYSSVLGLHHLERAVLGFMEQLGQRPVRLGDLLETLALDEGSRRTDHPCYHDPSGGPELPVHLGAQNLRRARSRAGRLAQRTGVRLAQLRATVVFEDRFNRMVGECGNKALCAWRFVAGHLEEIWRDYGEAHPHVVIDRQGGRIYYLELLAALFPKARFCVHEETPARSRYELSGGSRSMRITVQVESEREHLPAAFASMTAKYVRELLMLRFQDFWLRNAPGVRPSAGYYRDGRRFLREIEPFLTRMPLDRATFIRRC